MTSIRPPIQPPGGFTGKPAPRRRTESTTTEVGHEDHYPPTARGFQTIPAPDVLGGLIRRALAALKEGIVWDRGSILNIEA